MAKNNEVQATPEFNRIVAGTSVQGEIKSNSDIRVDGSVTGKINSKGKVVVGPTGQIDGEVICQNADISGSIKAKITVHELLCLKATAKISGDIFTNKLAIDPGAIFTGTCNMGVDTKQIKDVQQPKEQKEQKEQKEHVKEKFA